MIEISLYYVGGLGFLLEVCGVGKMFFNFWFMWEWFVEWDLFLKEVLVDYIFVGI